MTKYHEATQRRWLAQLTDVPGQLCPRWQCEGRPAAYIHSYSEGHTSLPPGLRPADRGGLALWAPPVVPLCPTGHPCPMHSVDGGGGHGGLTSGQGVKRDVQLESTATQAALIASTTVH
jgi:hypothetical protein